ncbi:glycoside hydrolase superfamily [Aspergillus desertorum]
MHRKETNQLFGISYSPYNVDNTCKSQEQVNTDIDKLTLYAFVRIYGVDCGQAQKVITAARRHNLQVFAGVYDLQSLHTNLKTIVDAARPDLSTLHTISIGNELLNRGQNSAEDVTAAVTDARVYLRTLGYTGPVVTIDTSSKVLEHPELCHVSDYCAANCHAFFDAQKTPENAGSYVAYISRRLSEVSRGKRTLITESGWPHAGQSNGKVYRPRRTSRRPLKVCATRSGVTMVILYFLVRLMICGRSTITGRLGRGDFGALRSGSFYWICCCLVVMLLLMLVSCHVLHPCHHNLTTLCSLLSTAAFCCLFCY